MANQTCSSLQDKITAWSNGVSVDNGNANRSAGQCQALCREHEECVAVAHRTSDGLCLFYSKLNNVSYPGVDCFEKKVIEGVPCRVGPRGSFASASLFQPWVQVPRCEEYTGTVCKGAVQGLVYIQENSTQNEWEEGFRAVISGLMLAPIQCQDPLATFICQTVFPACYTQTVTLLGDITLTLPSFSCKPKCEAYKENCAGFYNNLPKDPKYQMLLPNCSATLPASSQCGVPQSTGIELFPEAKTVFGLPLISSPCNNATPANAAKLLTDSLDCPLPLVRATDYMLQKAQQFPDDPYVAGLCSQPCPSHVWTDKQWEKGEALVGFCSWASVLLTSYLLVTYLTFPQKRKHRFVIYFLTCTLLVTSVIALGGPLSYTGRYKDVACKSERQPYYADITGSGFCVFQALMLWFGTIAACNWWLLFALDLYLKVVVEEKALPLEKQRRRSVCYHCYAWGESVFGILCVYWDGGGFGAETLVPYCFTDVTTDTNVTRVLFYFYMLVCGLCGTFFMVRIMLKLTRAAKKNHHALRKDKTCSRLLRPMLFIFIFDLFFLLSASVRVHYEIYGDEIEQALLKW
eukprot:CAMPEP_0175120010 /NCGR_PEP_ID=MMETSP0087-20121206/385_1 /TAXON_ID=136419 /ORGANISM="Unknown Unknown, Strain D1" /LENGTH=574 /DNA_ID=CAMNT_0016401413 /DNA_START=179 /DNA_END=1900 /DNA_ORIENTATION=-